MTVQDGNDNNIMTTTITKSKKRRFLRPLPLSLSFASLSITSLSSLLPSCRQRPVIVPFCHANTATVRTPHRTESASSSSPLKSIHASLRRRRTQERHPPLSSSSSSSSSSSLRLPSPRIINGTPAPRDRYPYIVSLTYHGSHLCGASLLAPDVVLTAAHCAGYATSVEIGRHDRGADDAAPPSSWQSVEVRYELPHPSYDDVTVDNDVMLVKLVRAVENPSLATLNVDPSVPAAGDLTILGWGDTDPADDVSVMAEELLYARVSYVTNEECEGTDGEVEPGGDFSSYRGRITDGMMCAMGESGEDTCQGDSGSPMVMEAADGGLEEGRAGGGGELGDRVRESRVSGGVCEGQRAVGVDTGGGLREEESPPEGFACDELSVEGQEEGEEGGAGGTEGGAADDDDGNSTSPQPPPPPPQLEPDDPTKHYLAVELALDAHPHQTSWILASLFQTPPQPRPPLVATVPTGFYAGYPHHAFHHVLEIPDPNQFYKLVLLDGNGDGWDDNDDNNDNIDNIGGGYLAVYRGRDTLATNLLMYDPTFRGKSIAHAFYPGESPPHHLTLAIQFDKYPRDVSWTLELVKPNNNNNDDDDKEEIVLAQRPPQWYNERFELLSIVETIPVLDKDTLIGNGG
eukprot:CAMPEP_0171360184 /NCGR_PEP_ID=MMETSP0879-20121228/1079_1 /TAXON_ID=67004 /ORGANISM="Thalassiosira weissflogii, Strain CCMP1336" /LENGTH=629 /DNA_ID=CAMNT_0011866477 /DNA_START=197 /DNA_END=2083 /DNA_ORIENTATION=-